MSWKNGKVWSDRFLPEIKSILGRHLIAEPPVEEDMRHNTDLIVLRLDAVRIGCRVRRFQYVQSFGGEFTIRSGARSGAKTEITKIIEGWGDYFFYGFADWQEQALHQWALCDLNVFRIWHSRRLFADKAMPGKTHQNADGTALTAFRFADLPPHFVVASSAQQDIPEEARA